MDSKSFRRTLRKNATPAEKMMWQLLRNRLLVGKKFRRQVSIDQYIVDFVCFEHRLVIELDGQGHYALSINEEADMERDVRLKELGFTVIRFENKFVLQQQENVLAEVARHLGITDFDL
jgi:very-short-patch-repair endonuclease